jgi:hypothetical protein
MGENAKNMLKATACVSVTQLGKTRSTARKNRCKNFEVVAGFKVFSIGLRQNSLLFSFLGEIRGFASTSVQHDRHRSTAHMLLDSSLIP